MPKSHSRFPVSSILVFWLVVTFPLFNEIAGAQATTVACEDLISISNWWSPSRKDNFATTDPSWAGKVGEKRSPDYRLFRIEGLIFREQKAGTIPLYSWYSPGRGDNFLTSNPDWSGQEGDRKSPDYRFVRVEGYIHDPNIPPPIHSSIVPLNSFWSPSRKDNFSTSDGIWAGAVGETRDPDYRLFRNEGYIYTSCDTNLH